MSTALKNSCETANRGRIPDSDSRILWLALVHGLTIFLAAARKVLRIGKHCPHCGNVL